MVLPELQQRMPLDGVATLLGRRIGALLVPVLVCILLVSWSALNLSPFLFREQMPAFFVVMDEDTHDTIKGKLGSSLLNALIVVAILTVMTFLIVLLYTYHCEKVLFALLLLSAASALSSMLWIWLDLFCTRFQIPYDFVTCTFLLWNVGVVGLISIFYYAHPVLTQAYLVVLSVLTGWTMTFLPEWTTWAILVFVALYDVVAVLSPRGPLKMLIQIADKRKQPIPGFVYSTHTANELEHAPRPSGDLTGEEARRSDDSSRTDSENSVTAERNSKLASASLLYSALNRSPFKLGLGDFIFYSVLSARAALYAFMPCMASTLAVCLGLVVTLASLILCTGRLPALPALPVSICLGVLLFFSYRCVATSLDYFAALSVLAI
ncbi:presenilin-like aspartic peptidase [Trypanosoma conorhini]|uniref:Presenilin n=1 Tax=Trypanosoma conorhini TaxID=83891 RepID=A0A422P7Z3_9TRYP|nr:presenilin-like aspartic peptidase [Trypanosoma conorhini]RNF13826.1 presenilin-like aspartic peptidase [Trypanosoma conorhini]